jgi:uncharacterized OB-fold protein
VKDGLTVWECAGCRRIVFPRRLLCPDCGSAAWRRRRAESGRVEEVTLVRRAPGRTLLAPVRLGSVRLEVGPLVVARLEPAASAGMRVRLREDNGVPVAVAERSAGANH